MSTRRGKGRALVVGSLPPPHNGMTVVTETILSSWLRQGFDIVHVDTSDHRTIADSRYGYGGSYGGYSSTTTTVPRLEDQQRESVN
jgi:hypothetical protein